MGLLGKGLEELAKWVVKDTAENVVDDITATAVGAAFSVMDKLDNKKSKDNTSLIKPSRSSDDYLYVDAEDVVKELIKCGFESVTLRADKSLGKWGRRNYGKVKSITINGKDEFFKWAKFPSDSYVIIEYYDLKENVDAAALGVDLRIKPGVYNRNGNSEDTKTVVTNKCQYCGANITGSIGESVKCEFCDCVSVIKG